MEAPPGYTYTNDKYYKIAITLVSPYWEAMQDCKADGARLARMKTLDEYVAVWLKMVQGKIYIFELVGASTGCCLLGIQS